MSDEVIFEREKGRTDLLSSLVLKIIACVLMTLDHVALFFIESGYPNYDTAYYVLRAIGKCCFPIFVFLAIEAVYKSKNIRNYLLRLGICAFALDGFGYIVGAIYGLSVASNPMIGNAFMDMFLGALCVYLLKRKDWWSLLAAVPVALSVLADYSINSDWGTIFKADWGFYSMVMFILCFVARELSSFWAHKKADDDGVEYEVYAKQEFFYMKAFQAVAVFLTGAIFYLIYRIDNTSWLVPNEFVPIGSYSLLGGLIILLYSGDKGYGRKWVRNSFYVYYPLHIAVLGLISLYCGVLA